MRQPFILTARGIVAVHEIALVLGLVTLFCR